MSNLKITTQGIKGNIPKLSEVGYCGLKIEDDLNNQIVISADVFIGSGIGYKRRDSAIIKFDLCDGNNEYSFTISELKKMLIEYDVEKELKEWDKLNK